MNGETPKALERYKKIIKQYKRKDIIEKSLYNLANIYKAQGNLDAAFYYFVKLYFEYNLIKFIRK